MPSWCPTSVARHVGQDAICPVASRHRAMLDTAPASPQDKVRAAKRFHLRDGDMSFILLSVDRLGASGSRVTVRAGSGS